MHYKTKKLIETLTEIEQERKKERKKIFLAGVITGISLAMISLAINTFKGYLEERDKEFQQYIEKKAQCQTYENAINKLKPVLLDQDPKVINSFNTLVDKFSQENCPQILYNF